MPKAIKNKVIKTVKKVVSSQSAKAKGSKKRTLSQQDLEKAAYYRWLNRGGQQGDPDQDWIEAEKQLRQN